MRTGLVAVVLVCSLLAVSPIATGTDGPVDPTTLSASHSSLGGDPTADAPSPTVLPSLESPTPPLAARSQSVADRCPDGPTASTRKRAAAIDRGDRPRVVELYPNPTTDGNVGEYFVVAFPDETNLANWTVTDGHTTAGFPNDSVDGRVAFSLDPDETRRLTDDPVVELEGHLRLAADGDDLELRRDGRVVDAVSYDRASTADVWYRADGSGGVWWPGGATCRPVSTADVDEATAFVLPDSPDVPLETLAAADERILLAGYTFTSRAVADELVAAADRGVDVTVLLEAAPVGGMPDGTRAVLDELAAAGVTVRVLGGEDARYVYHHPKYAVVDDRALVLTENWKPSGVGGASSRGWGVRVDDADVATTLATVFRADADGRDTTPWADYRETAQFVDAESSTGEFAARTTSETVAVDSVEVLLAPDNAEARTLELLAGAEESIRIEQVQIGDRTFPLLEASLEAARRGVDVRILLDATWYVEDENRELAAWLERTADAEDLPLEVRLVEPRGRFEKLHAKGVVVDGETVIVGSANWNDNSFRDNREVLLVLHGSEVGAFYADVFDADWDGGSWPLPVALVGVLAIALVAAGFAGRRYVAFDARGGSDDTFR